MTNKNEHPNKTTNQHPLVHFDSDDITIQTVDGAFVQLERNQGRIVFYQKVPHFNAKEHDEIKTTCRCFIELRMPITTMLGLTEIMAFKLAEQATRERSKQNQTLNIETTPSDASPMFM